MHFVRRFFGFGFLISGLDGVDPASPVWPIWMLDFASLSFHHRSSTPPSSWRHRETISMKRLTATDAGIVNPYRCGEEIACCLIRSTPMSARKSMGPDVHISFPASVCTLLRNLSDKLYEKRKNAAVEVEGIIKQLIVAGDDDKINAMINLLTHEFTSSNQTSHRKGGLIGLAAITVGLSAEAAQHLEEIVPPVINSFSHQHSKFRYYACEALYNIAKVVRGDFIVFFNQIFDALCKLSADSDPNVESAAHLLDRLVKCWTADSVPDIDMLGFLPDFLDGLFNMLSDSSHEIRQQADSALSEFLQEIKNSPVRLLYKSDIIS
ncbi:hypothetical protein L2E82_39333 [Cichorium intybus]|uniref:Uncharacterized protein n=1 Tax=Cichorium intybus TaxID=13427 RepID=A0ACB9AH74_CICIN|nr:hypothetical protein L2E82_39333 [Cichorium intybus]